MCINTFFLSFWFCVLVFEQHLLLCLIMIKGGDNNHWADTFIRLLYVLIKWTAMITELWHSNNSILAFNTEIICETHSFYIKSAHGSLKSIFNDLMRKSSSSDAIIDLTKGSQYRNLNIIFIKQNLFHYGFRNTDNAIFLSTQIT